MYKELLIGKNNEASACLLSNMANRHGLIAGATGTGKTVTLQVLAESFSDIGVPVFMADIKGDLSGILKAGSLGDKIKARLEQLQISDYVNKTYPVVFWDLFGEQGHPIRTTISEMGPLLLSRLLNLNETQSGVLDIAFKFSDDNQMLLLDLKDLKAVIQEIAERSKELTKSYGNVAPASVGAIQRAILSLEAQGGDIFFAEPAINLDDIIQTANDGRGVVNILTADKLINHPKLYSTFLLWLLSELFEKLPEVGDLEKPKVVFFFDEAHLLFDEAPKILIDKVEQVVRLIRSKGVGVYFITQNPLDVPEEVLAQLGNRVQHALRAFTPKDQKAVSTAAKTFRANPKLKTEEAITELAVGEALVSFLDIKGTPTPVERVLIKPPSAKIGPVTQEERIATIKSSVVYGAYEKTIDRESAFEILKKRAEERLKEEEELEKEKEEKKTGGNRQSFFEAFVKSTLRTVGNQVGRQIVRGILGSITKK